MTPMKAVRTTMSRLSPSRARMKLIPSSGIQARSKISSQGPPDAELVGRRGGGPTARAPARARPESRPARASGRHRRCGARRTRRRRHRQAEAGSAEPASCQHHDGDGDDRAETDPEGVGPDPAVLGSGERRVCRRRSPGRRSRRSRRTDRRRSSRARPTKGRTNSRSYSVSKPHPDEPESVEPRAQRRCLDRRRGSPVV